MMPRKLSTSQRSVLFLVIGVVGLVLLVATAVLIVLDPEEPAPYFTAVSALCLTIFGLASRRATRTK